MITELSVMNVNGNSMSFPIPSGGDGYLIKDVKGLDPVPVSLVGSTQANLSGERFQASKRDKRNIVLTIEIQKGYAGVSVEDRRRALYSLMVPETALTLFFETTHFGRVSIEGYVETFEAPIFGNDSTKATVSIVCFRPEFVGEEIVHDFPSSDTFEVSNPGTIPCGIVFQSSFSTVITSFSVRLDPDMEMAENGSTSLYATGLSNTIRAISGSTIPGEKSFVDGNGQSLVSNLRANNVWVLCRPGLNYASIKYTPGSTVATHGISFNPLYGAL